MLQLTLNVLKPIIPVKATPGDKGIVIIKFPALSITAFIKIAALLFKPIMRVLTADTGRNRDGITVWILHDVHPEAVIPSCALDDICKLINFPTRTKRNENAPTVTGPTKLV